MHERTSPSGRSSALTWTFPRSLDFIFQEEGEDDHLGLFGQHISLDLPDFMMEQQHSSTPSLPSSPAPTVPDSSSQQPTYTTAGTIYNPGSSQPLQPPARRARSFKWPVGSIHSDLALLPKSALDSLPFRRLGGGSGSATNAARYATVQQYTPLQQNYDRASNPFLNHDSDEFTMPAETPSMRSGNTPAPVSSMFVDRSTQDETGDVMQEHDIDDDDKDTSEDPLLNNLPVQSLYNLSLYPNPSQERAKKALRRGEKSFLRSAQPSLAGPSASSRGRDPMPPSLRPIAADSVTTKRGSFTPTTMLRQAQSDAEANRRTQPDSRSNVNTSRLAGSRSVYPRFSGTGQNDETDVRDRASTTLSTGPGAPRPLTAGPPGQRQYRPSTFESTFKTLSTLEERLKPQSDETPIIGRQSTPQLSRYPKPVVPASLDGEDFDRGSLGESRTSAYVVLPEDWLPPIKLVDWPREFLGPIGTAIDSRIVIPAKPQGRLSEDGPGAWGQRVQLDKQQTTRQETIDWHWYAGADLLGKTILDHMEDAAQQSTGYRDGSWSRNKGIHYRPMAVEEAKQVPVWQHAEPLVNMMFGTMVRHVHDSTLFEQFEDPERELVNDSPLGQSPFYTRLLDD